LDCELAAAAFLYFAQRAFWAAAIRDRADAESFLVPFPYALPKAASAAPMPRSSVVNRFCSFFNNRTTAAKLDIEFPFAICRKKINLPGFRLGRM
jgi:hypothetical protein